MFQYENKAQKVYELLKERLKKFKLELAEDKTRILPFGRFKGNKESFDFLGFSHHNSKTRTGKYTIQHKISKKKKKAKKQAIKHWAIQMNMDIIILRITGLMKHLEHLFVRNIT